MIFSFKYVENKKQCLSRIQKKYWIILFPFLFFTSHIVYLGRKWKPYCNVPKIVREKRRETKRPLQALATKEDRAWEDWLVHNREAVTALPSRSGHGYVYYSLSTHRKIRVIINADSPHIMAACAGSAIHSQNMGKA